MFNPKIWYSNLVNSSRSREGFYLIYVIRHGQTDLNKEGKLQGRQGLPLNEIGVEQALCLKESLKDIQFDHVFSSPQVRAIQTAELATGLMVTVDERLISVF